jgi:hypothetical protein
VRGIITDVQTTVGDMNTHEIIRSADKGPRSDGPSLMEQTWKGKAEFYRMI